MRVGPSFVLGLALVALVGAGALAGDVPPGEGPALPSNRMTQAQIAAGEVSREEIRLQGLTLFTTPFNRHDGYGDGPLDPANPLAPGGRPTLQGGGTFLRVNGLDAQTCLECHSVVRASTSPPTLGIGGVGGSNSNAIISPSVIDMLDGDLDGKAGFNGRFANPPFLFGSGGVELLALEMTADLQGLRQRALDHPGETVDLETKGVWFGTITADATGAIDWTNLEGVASDLVVRPFGRKGEFATVREFDTGATQFHFGMQPVEVVGQDVDADGDGVVNEIRAGDLSALHVFATTLERPFAERLEGAAMRGFTVFHDIGCTDCHKPMLHTERRKLPLRLPEVATRPFENVYYEVDLSAAPVKFDKYRDGLEVPLFSDLKRHDMGDRLKEDFALASDRTNREFVTARLWGIADSAPYLHDGRATTLTDAILFHGGEAQPVRERFEGLPDDARRDVLAFLRCLRTPDDPAKDLREKKAAAQKPWTYEGPLRKLMRRLFG